MRPIIIFLALAGIGIITWLIIARPGKTEEGPKGQAVAVSKHTPEFNASVATVLSDYEKLSETFVNWDSASVPASVNAMLKNVEGIKMDEIKKDSSAIYETAIGFVDNIKGTLQGMATETNIRPQREAFHNLTGNIKDFLNTVKYDREKFYLQECTMPYDGTGVGYWISKSGEDKDRRNPYLGLKDPKYGKGMLQCGNTITEINHTGKE
jgi:hypothetical protein